MNRIQSQSEMLLTCTVQSAEGLALGRRESESVSKPAERESVSKPAERESVSKPAERVRVCQSLQRG